LKALQEVFKELAGSKTPFKFITVNGETRLTVDGFSGLVRC